MLFMGRDLLTFFCISRLRTCSRIKSNWSFSLALLAWFAYLFLVSIIWKELHLKLRPFKNHVLYCQSGIFLIPISLSQVKFRLILFANCAISSKFESIGVKRWINIALHLINLVSWYSDLNFFHILEASPMSPICDIGSIVQVIRIVPWIGLVIMSYFMSLISKSSLFSKVNFSGGVGLEISPNM